LLLNPPKQTGATAPGRPLLAHEPGRGSCAVGAHTQIKAREGRVRGFLGGVLRCWPIVKGPPKKKWRFQEVPHPGFSAQRQLERVLVAGLLASAGQAGSAGRFCCCCGTNLLLTHPNRGGSLWPAFAGIGAGQGLLCRRRSHPNKSPSGALRRSRPLLFRSDRS
jgi:hypothetical protein